MVKCQLIYPDIGGISYILYLGRWENANICQYLQNENSWKGFKVAKTDQQNGQ